MLCTFRKEEILITFKKLTIAILILIFFKAVSTFSMEIEEGIVSLIINKSVKIDNLSAYFYKGEDPFIEISDFFEVLEINEYSIEKERIDFQLNGKNISRKIKVIRMGEKSLISSHMIEEIFEETQVEWDLSSMTIYVTTKETLPREFLALQEEKRKKLSEKKEDKVIKEEWKEFTPGILYLGYNKYDLDDGSESITTNYINQSFYGTSNLNATLYDGELDIDNFSWERSVGYERKVSVGDSYTTTPFNIGDSGSFRGMSLLGKNSWDASLDVSSKNIRGYAPNGATIELYENGILKDYQIVRNGEFNFEIKTTGGARNYEIWTYKPDGTIEKQPVSVYGSAQLVEEGEFDYEAQLGVDRDYTDYKPYNINVSYGVTEDFTLKVGGYNSRYEAEEREYLNLAPTYRIGGRGNWSHVIYGDLSTNTSDSDERFYKAELQSGNGKVQNTFGLENYKSLDLRFLNEDYEEKFYWKNNFSVYGINTGLSFEKEKSDSRSEDIDRYGLTLYDTLFRGRITASIDIEREEEKRPEYSRTGNDYGVGLTYNIQNRSLKRYIDSIGFSYDRDSSESDSYGVTFQKNRGTEGKYDYYLSLERDEEEFVVELTFTYRLGEWMNIRSNSRRSDDETINGIEVNTAVDFSNPKKIYYSEYSGDSSIRGTAFLDSNGNGIKDPEEKGVSNIIVRNAAGSGVTDKQGNYYIPLLSSRVTHTLKVENKNEDYMLNYNIPEKYKAKTLPGGVLELNVPVRQMKTVVGFIEFSSDFYLEEAEEALSSLHLKVTDLNTKKVTNVEISSEYFISELPQGEYIFELVCDGNQNLNIINCRYIVNMKDSEELEEYLDFSVSKVMDSVYTIELAHNGDILYSLDEVKDTNERVAKNFKGGN